MIKLGIAGFGKIGQLRMEILLERNDVEIVGVYDVVKPTKIKAGVFFESYDDLLNSDLDAVFICAYNTVLADYTARALNKGLHVFCEKPPAMKIEELGIVSKALKSSGKVLKYGFNHRYHYSVMEAKKIIDSGKMGKLLWLRGVYGKAGSIDYDKNWRNFQKYSGGGILIDQGIHMLDLIRYFSGEKFNKINSYITTAYWNIKVEDNAFVLMQSDNNVIASMHSSATQWKHKFLLEICFEEGYINLDGILSGTRSYAPEKLIIGRREFEDVTFAMGKPKESIVYFENDHSWNLEVDEFIGAVNGDGIIKEGTFKDAYETLSLVQRVYENSEI
ncbi:Gfo/Idh/MocA family oxidoreductase [Flavobacteriaceae bacterium]|nr:Gfo/Idh/MocA family oxidoreductase [Flavobacteriaceae bacterium]MDC1343663.1 Gfo/Idh/MocA family oxidoreductase [Flavobacteriaceae bacterium]